MGTLSDSGQSIEDLRETEREREREREREIMGVRKRETERE